MLSQNQPLVSIIIPAYRAESTIVSTIQSIQNQTYTNWEMIIGSDDGKDYIDLLTHQGIHDSRIKQTYTGGVGTGEAPARNQAVAMSTGDILANLDADDAFRSDRLAELVPLAVEYGAAIDNTGVYNTDLVLYKQPFGDRATLSFATSDDILKPRTPFFPVFRREFLGQGWTKVPFAADVLFNLELLSRVENIAIHPHPLYQYYKRENSITQAADAFDTAERSYKQILDLLSQGSLDLTDTIRTAAQDEFNQNLLLNRLFRSYMHQG
ncbi:MAG: glycosyltransferase family 2 protein, partial [Merismopedia sp. SIO2A8]|nr:glycosyltransferase family 2 protein [Merismopedia sp. SIO2A8]